MILKYQLSMSASFTFLQKAFLQSFFFSGLLYNTAYFILHDILYIPLPALKASSQSIIHNYTLHKSLWDFSWFSVWYFLMLFSDSNINKINSLAILFTYFYIFIFVHNLFLLINSNCLVSFLLINIIQFKNLT